MNELEMEAFKEEYFDSPHCPYCKSEKLDSSNLRFKNGVVKADVICRQCWKYWQEIYQAVDLFFE